MDSVGERPTRPFLPSPEIARHAAHPAICIDLSRTGESAGKPDPQLSHLAGTSTRAARNVDPSKCAAQSA